MAAVFRLIMSEPRAHFVAGTLEEATILAAKTAFATMSVMPFTVTVIIRMSHTTSCHGSKQIPICNAQTSHRTAAAARP
jgi:hypothetical protein